MKKIAKILVVQLLLIFLMITSVYAEDEPCKISLTVDKTKVKPGDEITINVLMSNITKEEGVKSISAILNISTDVFDIEFDDSLEGEEVIAQFEEALGENDEVYPIYIGENDEDTSSDWNAILYIDGTGGLGIMTYADEPKTQTQTVAKIKLTVNDDVSETQTKVWLDNIIAYGEDKDGAEAQDSNVITFTIESDDVGSGTGSGIGSSTGSGSGSSQTPNNNNNNKSENANKNTNLGPSNRGAPYTGIEDYFPGFVVIMLFIVSIATYYIYKNEYRNIN